jgi:hypothetical protein
MRQLGWWCVVLGAVVAPATAMADDPQSPTPPAEQPAEPAEEVTPPAPPAHEPARPPDPPPPRPRRADDGGRARRPVGYAIGVGLGYDLPADLQAPNTTSVRFRMHSGLTLEPSATLGVSGQSADPGGSDSTFELSIGTDARWPLRAHGPVDLVLVIGGGFTVVGNSPDGDDNDSTTIQLDVGWGLGLDYWFSPHWSLSLTATNPFFRMTTTSMEQVGGDDQSQSTYLVGAIWEPDVVAMLHLFF